eukprot:g15714.t1
MAESASDKDSCASSGWSDEEGDEYLAKALASDEYLQGSGGSSSSTLPPPPPVAAGAATGSTTSCGGTTGKRGTILVHHPLCELHDIPDHPERPARVRAIMNALTRNYPEMCTLLAPEATVEQVLRFHDQPHVDKILRLCTESEKRGKLASTEGGRGGPGMRGSPAGRRNQRPGIIQIDPDTAVMPLSRAAIFRAAGAACFAVDEVMSGRATNAFCCVRPPGHHAEPDKAMGFCFFNNAPIGALHAKVVHGAERVAVVDIDVHHGNGTQALFRGDPTTFYASTHQGPEFYPGTGYDDITGVESNIVNVSMDDGEGSEGFRTAYSESIVPALEAFRPELIVISAGFDAHVDDPLAGITVDEEDYRWVTREICAVADRVCGGRVVSILEGGYNLQAISDSAVAHVDALRQAAAAATPPPQAEDATTATATAAATSPSAAAITAAATGGEDPVKAPSSPSGTPAVVKEDGASENELVSGDAATASTGGVSKAVTGSDVDAAPVAATAAAGSEADAAGAPAEGAPGAEEDHEDIDLMLAQLSLQDAVAGGAEAKAGGPPLPL